MAKELFSLAEKVKLLREHIKLTQSDLARQMGLTLQRECLGDGAFGAIYTIHRRVSKNIWSINGLFAGDGDGCSN